MTSHVPVGRVAMSAGASGPTCLFGPLTRTHFVKYAGAAGDFNPLHHDDDVARAAGMPQVFGMGMLTAGLLGMWLARWVGPTNIETFSVRFGGLVFPGDTLSLTGAVDTLSAPEGPCIAHITLAVRRAGDVILRGTARARVIAQTNDPQTAAP